MTKSEFLRSIPDIITHKAHGYAELEIIVDRSNKKGVCYRHRDNVASCGTYGESWQEVFTKLSKHLIQEGYMQAAH